MITKKQIVEKFCNKYLEILGAGGKRKKMKIGCVEFIGNIDNDIELRVNTSPSSYGVLLNNVKIEELYNHNSCLYNKKAYILEGYEVTCEDDLYTKECFTMQNVIVTDKKTGKTSSEIKIINR